MNIINDATENLTPAQVAHARALADSGDVSGAWRYLGQQGDSYADNAADVVAITDSSSAYGRFAHELVKQHWANTAGPSAYAEKFYQVASDHLSNYLDVLDKGVWPNTKDIEKSYRDAIVKNGLPPITAVDGAVSEGLGDGVWPVGLGIPLEQPSRVVPSDIFDDIDSGVAQYKLLQTVIDTVAIKLKQQPGIFNEILREGYESTKGYVQRAGLALFSDKFQSSLGNEISVGISSDLEFARNTLSPVAPVSSDGIHAAKPEARPSALAWIIDTINLMAPQYTYGNDMLTDYAADVQLRGGLGSDTLLGGAGNDRLDGGAGSNRLYGAAGNDTLKVSAVANNNKFVGGAGDDMLHGSYYNDTYVFNRGDGQDTIVEKHGSRSSTDVLQLGSGVNPDDLWFKQNRKDLEITVGDTQDTVLVKNWYSSKSSRVERFEAADGRVLLDSQVQGLVDAMAAFGAHSGGESGLATDQRQQLEVVLASSWQ